MHRSCAYEALGLKEMQARASLNKIEEGLSFGHFLASLPTPYYKEEVASLGILQEEVDTLGILAGRVQLHYVFV